ncbi:MAG: amidohydrolase family protein [Solirubrobacterales bacterium]|nr:amidohydrolase family protein [Solirubrobacterales bacterium]
MLEPRAAAMGAAHNVVTGFGAKAMPSASPGSAQEMAERAGYDVELHVEMLNRLELDAEVLSSMTVMQGTAWATTAVAGELSQRINDAIVDWVARYPTRILGSFTLPLQSLDLSLNELERCTTDLGMRVLQLPAAVNGTYLSSPDYADLWEAVAERRLVVFVHPDGTPDPWFQSYSMWNSVGQPIEEAKFIASLIYEGVLERLPELRIVMAHGGGYLPHYYGRLDRNVRAHPHSAVNLSRPPSAYLRDLYYDTCLYEPAMLDALVARVGAERLVMGSDYPVGDPDPVGFVERSVSLDSEQLAAVLGGTLANLLELTATPTGLGVVASRETG